MNGTSSRTSWWTGPLACAAAAEMRKPTGGEIRPRGLEDGQDGHRLGHGAGDFIAAAVPAASHPEFHVRAISQEVGQTAEKRCRRKAAHQAVVEGETRRHRPAG